MCGPVESRRYGRLEIWHRAQARFEATFTVKERSGAAFLPGMRALLLRVLFAGESGENIIRCALNRDVKIALMQGQLVDTKDLDAVRSEVARIYQELFPSGRPGFVNETFGWVTDAFAGRYSDFQKIDAKYHDLEHTLQGTLAFARLLWGYKEASAEPLLTQRAFELGLLAILLHDTGYLKRRADAGGTGAKYTLVHVSRSAEFAAGLLKEKGFAPNEIRSIQNMIRCTGVNADLGSIPFADELERRVGFALGTADLLGQMAAPDYIEKLEILFLEFEESNRYSGKGTGSGLFNSAAELRRNTPVFWEKYVLPKIENDFIGLYRFLDDRNGRNKYIDRIQANIARLQQELTGAVARV